jgi:hypothetical protein
MRFFAVSDFESVRGFAARQSTMIFTGDGVLLLKTPYMTAGRPSKSPTAKYKKPVKVIDFNVGKIAMKLMLLMLLTLSASAWAI